MAFTEQLVITATLGAILVPAAQIQQHSWYPKYHIAPEKGWMNDPNGLIYFKGSYHVFWQYNPDEPKWGLMRWGHARSSDLLTWERLPIALAPSLPEDSDGIFSGSAVVKDNNLTIIYTGVGDGGKRQLQMAATSSDGINFVKLGVIIERKGEEANFRDPKAWWQNDTWFVVVGAQTAQKTGQILLYKSQDFLNWTFEGPLAQADQKLGSMWECPDFFALEDKQILLLSPIGIQQDGDKHLGQTGYFVGTWAPGSIYTVEKEFKEVDYGHDFYAAQTFLAPNNRRIMIGWLEGGVEAPVPENKDGWAGMLSLPRELTLSELGKLEIRPIREIKAKRKPRNTFKKLRISHNTPPFVLEGSLFSAELNVTFYNGKSTPETYGIALKNSTTNGLSVFINKTESKLYLCRYYMKKSCRRTNVDLTLSETSLDVFIDGSSIEVFVNDGESVLSSRIYPNDDQRDFYVITHGRGIIGLTYSIWDF